MLYFLELLDVHISTSIAGIEEKLLNGGIYLPGTRTLYGNAIVTIEPETVFASELDCADIAKLLVLYTTTTEGKQIRNTETLSNTNLETSEQRYTILVAIKRTQEFSIVNLILQSLTLAFRHTSNWEVLAIFLEQNLMESFNCQQRNKNLKLPIVKVKMFDDLVEAIDVTQVPHRELQGLHHHDQKSWCEFITQLEPFQRQCATVGRSLACLMNTLRSIGMREQSTRLMLYAQNEALNRALQDPEVVAFRKLGPATLVHLQGLSKRINGNSAGTGSNTTNIDIEIKQRRVALLYDDINQALNRLEQLATQYRKHFHELNFSQTLDNEANVLLHCCSNKVDKPDEDQSRKSDSGLGDCERCEKNASFSRSCSYQSLNSFEKSSNNDALDDLCFNRSSKQYSAAYLPVETNSHLMCHASSMELPKLDKIKNLGPKIQKMLLLIIREMISTERDYVRSLGYVIENYVPELQREDVPQPLRGQRNVIFGNIEKIYEFHNFFVYELERYEYEPLKVGAAFLQMEPKFYLYALYNKNKPKSDALMSEYGTDFFKSKQLYLKDRMDLASYLVKPVQRMGKYALLLQQLVKACSTAVSAALEEISTDLEELELAEKMVKFQLRHGNDLLAMDSLRECDVNVKEQGRLLRQNEFLVWQGRNGRKSIRQVFLFEDLVLFSKARRFPDSKNLDIFIYKNSIKTSDIGLTAHIGDSPLRFELWFRKRKREDTWTLQCSTEDIKKAWTEEISKLLWKQAKRNREMRLAEMSSMGIGSKPCLDIRPSNNQINDRSINISQTTPKLRHSVTYTDSDLRMDGCFSSGTNKISTISFTD